MKFSSKTRRSIGFIFVLSIAVVMMIGCSDGGMGSNPFNMPDFESAVFDDSTTINNPFTTLIPGTAFCYKSETEDGTETNEVTVVDTDCNLELAGLKTIVVRDVVRLDGVLTEDTYDFYAQDNDGNVWYLGEATKTCEDNMTEGTWNADEPGAEPGIVMLADPMPGNSYQQEFLADVAEDLGKVLRLNANVSVPYGDFEDCLKTEETTPLEPGKIEHKYYARDIAPGIGGLVLVEELDGEPVRTELIDVLTGLTETGRCPSDFADALASICKEASPPPMNCKFE
jgi:hypothetical protein